jgi:hypothetical protein
MTDAKKVWMPDTFFRNEKEGRFHNILVPNVYIRIFPEGNVLYSIRYARYLNMFYNSNICMRKGMSVYSSVLYSIRYETYLYM